ncbi:hypothetical protein ASswx1_69 [Aeromonas phage Asswx_1]|uniref:ADP ribosyltransferase domain-containing protein n=1 Tax=Aeromonas phage Asswx_1 TaxID=2419739 RepID=A0A411B7X3_9CAUD|nr:hypothetical protein ASswx1_69 [Aeromonas phage Asswx_1]
MNVNEKNDETTVNIINLFSDEDIVKMRSSSSSNYRSIMASVFDNIDISSYTKEDKELIDNYALDYYINTNKFLCGEELSPDLNPSAVDVNEYIRKMHDVIDRSCTISARLYRTIYLSKSQWEEVLKKKEITNLGFCSTSINPVPFKPVDGMRDDNVKIQIEFYVNDMKAIPVCTVLKDKESSFKSEMEFLLPPGITFSIEKIISNNKHYKDKAFVYKRLICRIK